MDDQVAILKGSPEMSVLESTRKDFEAMLSVAKKADLSTDEESSRRGIARLVKRTQLNSQLRRIRKNHEQTPLELPEMVRVQSSSRDSYTGTSNATFRYEEEDISSGSKTSASSSRSSSKSGTRKLLQHGRHSGSSVEHHVMVHNESQMGSLKSGQEETSDEEESSSQSNPSPLLPQRSSVSSATSKASKRISDIHSSAPTSQRSLPNQSSRRDSDSSNSERERGTVIRRGCGTAECRSLKVTVHQIDRWILLDQETAGQLIVAVHALNGDTGRYVLQNQLPIAPQFTEAWTWDVRHQSSIAGPAWNQEFAFEFDPGTSLTALLLVFEVMNERNLVAWGFVRPVSRTGVDHTGNKKLQLQLFRVPIRRLLIHPSRPTVSDFFSWIQLARKDKYPATLHATLVPVIGSPASARLDSTGRTTNLISPVSPSRRVRLAGQPFKLPTRKSFTLRPDATVAGALMAKYSPDGSSVAVALTCGDIFVHLTGNSLPTHLKGHQGNVYDLDWMMIDSSQEADQSAWLLSCGADSTARLWGKSNCLVMPHPAFVYCSRFLAKNLIVTGCYDQLIRLWAIHSSSVELVNSYTKHTAPVNCLCWDSSRDLLYSADAVGSICAWNVNDSDLHFDGMLNDRGEEFDNRIAVNWMCIHPSGTRLLVHYRGHHLCLIEPKSGIKLLTYNGIFNPRLRLTSSISPCGHYVVAGSEDGSVHWFDLERCDLLAVLTLPGSYHPVTAIAFHPTEHTLALCSLNPHEPMTVLEFNTDDTQVEGFSLVTFPRTVLSAAFPIENVSKVIDDPSISFHRESRGTPTLDKLEKIFRKLDLVMAWSRTNELD